MRKVVLGSSGIEVSKLGFGTGTAHPDGLSLQAMMDPGELAGLLRYALSRGVNFWDTALAYGTHAHLRKALEGVARDKVVIATKLVSSGKRESEEALNRSLREIGSDYVDLCLVHGVRTARELENRRGALEAMTAAREKGKVRAVGLSSHGLEALLAAAEHPGIEVVWARVNFAGLCMDSCRLSLYDRMASFPWLKKTVRKVLPGKLRAAVRPSPEKEKVDGADAARVHEAIAAIHSSGRGVVGMKILGEGALAHDAKRAVSHADGLIHVDALVIGMKSRREIDENSLLLS